MSNPAQRQYAYQALALLGLCALTSSPIARANDRAKLAAEPESQPSAGGTASTLAAR